MKKALAFLLLCAIPVVVTAQLLGGATTRVKAGTCSAETCNDFSPSFCRDGAVLYACDFVAGAYSAIATLDDAQTFTALQTFSGGIDSSFPGAMTAPAAPTAIQGPTTSGSCRSDTSYRFYISWKNVTGETTLSAASSPDFTPASGNTNKATVTRGTIPSDAGSWRVWFTRSTDSHVAVRGCSALGSVTEVAVGTSTFDCVCSTTTDPAEPTSNTTVDVSLFKAVSTGSAAYTARPALYVKEVCTVGCEYLTFATALAGITDAASTKRYTIFVHSGYADPAATTHTMKSYISVVGENRAVTLGNFQLPAALAGASFSNITIGFAHINGDGAGNVIYFDNVNLNSPGTTASNAFDDSYGGFTIFMNNCTLYGAVQGIGIGYTTVLYGSGNRIIVNGAGSGTTTCWWVSSVASGNRDGGYLYDYGSHCEITNTGTVLETSGVLMSTVASVASSIGNRVRLFSPTIIVNNTNASNATRTACYIVKTAIANSNANSLEVDDGNCTVTAAGSSAPVVGLAVDADADHANWSVRLRGGAIALSGGASQTDVVQAETVAGFTARLIDVEHAGVYSGAGTVSVDAPVSIGVRRLTPLATAPATCSIGDTYADTSGAFCTCSAANTWTNTNGVGACA